MHTMACAKAHDHSRPCTCGAVIETTLAKFREPVETIEHPTHYGGADNPYETIKVIEAWNLGFNLGNAVKYISRAGKKDPTKLVEDLKKARFYLDHEIQRIEGAQDVARPR